MTPTRVRPASERIAHWKTQRRAVILAHNYQPGPIQEFADFTGDSLELSRRAAETDADVIVFCGVRFMAESAKILSPEKTVLLPIQAGCPMADTITADQLRAAKRRYPEAAVVVYVNSSAEVKAEADICCTSANAIQVVNALYRDEVLMAPDRHLAAWVARHTSKRIIPWEGSCPVHAQMTAALVQSARLRHPGAKVLVHPECPLDVCELADGVLSTSQMLRRVAAEEEKEYVIGTENGLLYQLRRDHPGKRFFHLCDEALCPTMKVVTPDLLADALEFLHAPIELDPTIIRRAAAALDGMLRV